MTLPIHFATLHGGHQPLSLLDRQFAALGNLTTIPCIYDTADGNNILLTPFADTPSLTRYTDLAPQFIFTARSTNTGPATINVIGTQQHPGVSEMDLGSQPPGAGWPSPPPSVPLGARPVFVGGGTTPAVSGEIQSGAIYIATYAQVLNGGQGGFAVTSYGNNFGMDWPGWQTWTPIVSSASGPYGAATAHGSWLQNGHVVFFIANIDVSNKGVGGGFLTFTPPPPPIDTPTFGMGRQMGAPGSLGFVQVASPVCGYQNIDGSDPIPAGGVGLQITAWYPSG